MLNPHDLTDYAKDMIVEAYVREARLALVAAIGKQFGAYATDALDTSKPGGPVFLGFSIDELIELRCFIEEAGCKPSDLANRVAVDRHMWERASAALELADKLKVVLD